MIIYNISKHWEVSLLPNNVERISLTIHILESRSEKKCHWPYHLRLYSQCAVLPDGCCWKDVMLNAYVFAWIKAYQNIYSAHHIYLCKMCPHKEIHDEMML